MSILLTQLIAYLKRRYPVLDKFLNLKNSAIIFFVLWVLYNQLKNHGLWFGKKQLRGQHAFITGGGMGIGKQMAIRLAKLGCNITIVDINIESANKVVQELIEKYKIKAKAYQCDVSNLQNIKTVAQECVQQIGIVDILINNAGICHGKKILEASDQGIEKTIAINLTSHHYTVREFLPEMLKKNSGHIVSIASSAGHFGINGLVDYCASKFGAVGFDESLRHELKYLKSDVQTTCICPFFINTGMFQGVKSPFIPILDEKFVADRIIYAIQYNDRIIFLPFYFSIFAMLKTILPTAVSDQVMKLAKLNRSMDHFFGRDQQQQSQQQKLQSTVQQNK